MHEGTHAHPVKRTTRPRWRDAIKDDARLSANDVLVGLLVADFWKPDSEEPVWAAVDVLIRESRLSRAAVFKALKRLREVGYLVVVEPARHGRSPRWIPLLAPGHQSLRETNQSTPETGRSTGETRDHTKTSRTPHDGSKDLDCESRPADAGPPENPTYSAEPETSREHADYRLLGDHMANYTDDSVEMVYRRLRTGRYGKPIRFPGALAQRKHALSTNQAGVSQWQGYFVRVFLSNAEGAIHPRAGTRDTAAA